MTRHLYGIHDLSQEIGQIAQGKGIGLWMLDAIAIGHDPDDAGGPDYTHWTDQGHKIICRLNHGWHPYGTIPERPLWGAFSSRVGNVVAASKGCHHWAIGNEPNLDIEWPNGQQIDVMRYASELFPACRDIIRSLPGHENDVVMPWAIGPWNNTLGDYRDLYWNMMVTIRANGGCDALNWHTYTHGSSPALITDMGTMETIPGALYQFRAYQDWAANTPGDMLNLPAYITETDQNAPWQATGWILEAFREINDWNQHGHPIVDALFLYRAQSGDEYQIEDKPAVVAEFAAAMDKRYTVPPYDDGENGEDGDMAPKIENPSLEPPYAPQNQINEIQVAAGWTAYWDGAKKRPEYGPAMKAVDASRIYDNLNAAQKWFAMWDMMTAGIFQRIDGFTPGDKVTLHVPCQAWTDDGDDPKNSRGKMRFRIGLDPTGETDPARSSIVWTEQVEVSNTYVVIDVGPFLLNGDALTLYIEAENEWALKHNDAYVDAISMEVESGSTPPPPGEADTLYVYLGEQQLAAIPLHAQITDISYTGRVISP